MPDLQELWNYLREEFQNDLTPVGFNAWIKTAKPLAFRANEILIEVPSPLHKEYWESNLATKVVEGAYEFAEIELTPIFLLPTEAEQLQAEKPAEERSLTKAETPTFLRETHLNSKYTFDTFVTGKGNQMAHAAALVVSEEPGVLYNPLFLYGGVGLGKTHLMQAIGHQLLLSKPDTNVKYVTSEAFANDFINSIQTKNQEKFRQEYRNVDLLLVDDIQFFADKEGTQEEFFHTFNDLYNDKKQIVLTSDRLPNEIPKLQERLVSRFKWGLSVDITPPDLETRIAILRNKADTERLEIPEDTLSYIAGQIDSNVRELEGSLVRVQAYATMQNAEITTSLAADALKGLKLNGKSSQLSIAKIQSVVAKYYSLSITDLKGRKRVKEIVLPRQIAMYLAREMTDSSLPKIGQEFGGKDHTTVMHAHERISQALTSDQNLKDAILDLKNTLKG
ncbi:chromosomal replication initiator protein DnaA [Latilactobacillus curvatus]|jgi:chromosomal replication initiator protein|uniref:Chromosomal replication initiator protein DnaA n=2 Tax=Latilactobacillus curvatus TaxID=28038 RepID=A0A0B2XQG5_LATCU|nr:chromosomal replication initiator protein DnaA [Latilactobacillus curvatus]MDT3393980.1 chromosomal replication initiator protein DnaA [Bacillota bacterium]ANJ68601.1 chromosomal replication initiation protein DnaA [Latilactobacillus curvatus]ANY12717.1 chromosomal replication initiation protein DnaA [Latilactobacillus curvatus]AOO74605.1 chromosomal replication initiation protein DnaA [Latilactobacillus curvatus]ASN59112.1 chromosomal replication initiation protein DnaA [Latilactobacillus 